MKFSLPSAREQETTVAGPGAEFHGHPATRIDRSVLKQLRARGEVTEAEYRRLARELPGC